MSKKFAVAAAAILFILAAVIYFKIGTGSSALVWSLSGGGKLLLPLVVISALIDSINPCAFSILLLTIAFLFTLGKLRTDILKIGGFYILGIFLAYLMIGLGIFQAFHLFNTPHLMGKIGAGLLIVLGAVNLLNEFVPSFPVTLRIPRAAHQKMAILMERGSWFAVFLLGGLVGICEFPCTGGPYLAVLGLLHDQATYWRGAGYLLIYNLVFILPLLLILALASNARLLEKARQWQQTNKRAMRVGGGVAMIALGFVIFLF